MCFFEQMYQYKNNLNYFCRASVTGAMLGRKLSVVGEHSILATDFGEEAGVEIEGQDWTNK